LKGTVPFVQDARKAGFFVVAARDPKGVGLYVVAADAPGLTIRPDRVVDLTRDQASLVFDDVRVDKSAVVATGGAGAAAVPGVARS
jgi:alkylation response protein AidB-like acyl-CoA dehydrogenase